MTCNVNIWWDIWSVMPWLRTSTLKRKKKETRKETKSFSCTKTAERAERARPVYVALWDPDSHKAILPVFLEGQTFDCLDLRINNNHERLLETVNGATCDLLWLLLLPLLNVNLVWNVRRVYHEHSLIHSMFWQFGGKKILAQRQQDYTGCLLPKRSIRNSTGFQERKHTCGLGFVLRILRHPAFDSSGCTGKKKLQDTGSLRWICTSWALLLSLVLRLLQKLECD